MNMRFLDKPVGGGVLLYGALPAQERENLLLQLPFVPAVVSVASEHYGTAWGSKIDWTPMKRIADYTTPVPFVTWKSAGFASKINAASRRNIRAASEFNTLVIIGRPKFMTAISRVFKHRGRRIFWYSQKHLVEVDTAKCAPIAPGKRAVELVELASRAPKSARFEVEIWNEAAAERKELMDAVFTGEVGSVEVCNACTTCTFRKTCENRMRTTLRHIHRDGFSGRSIDGVPTFGWTEPVNDVDCADTDVLHPSVQREFKVDEFAKREKEVSKSFRELKEDPPPMWKMGLMTVCPQPDDLSTPTSDEQFEKWMIIIGQALHPAY